MQRTIAEVWDELFRETPDIIDLDDSAVLPGTPMDMFAATGVLLEVSGAYHRLQPTIHVRQTIAVILVTLLVWEKALACPGPH